MSGPLGSRRVAVGGGGAGPGAVIGVMWQCVGTPIALAPGGFLSLAPLGVWLGEQILHEVLGRGGLRGSRPIRSIGLWQQGHSGAGRGGVGGGAGVFQSKSAAMRWKRVLAAGLNQPK